MDVKDAGRVVAIAVLLAVVAGACGGGSGGGAARVAATISRRPDVTVYSAKRLHLEGPTIRETELGGPDAAHRLPAGWAPGNRRAALLLPDTDDLRVEFTPGRQAAWAYPLRGNSRTTR